MSSSMGSQQIGSDTGTSWSKVISNWFTADDLDLDVELERLFNAICPLSEGDEGVSPDQAFTMALDLVLGPEEVRLRAVFLEILAFRAGATRKETSPARKALLSDWYSPFFHGHGSLQKRLDTEFMTKLKAEDVKNRPSVDPVKFEFPTLDYGARIAGVKTEDTVMVDSAGNDGADTDNDVIDLDGETDAKTVRESRKEVESVKIIDGTPYSGFTDSRSFPSWRRKFLALCDSRGYNDYVLKYYALTRNLADNVQLRLKPTAPPSTAPMKKWKVEYERLMNELGMLTAGVDGDTGSWKSEQDLLAIRQTKSESTGSFLDRFETTVADLSSHGVALDSGRLIAALLSSLRQDVKEVA
ncbi:hypothetical protein FOL47_004344, partial [Perkinsus chesapeaki]